MPENIAYSSNYLIVIKTSQKIVIETTFPVGILPLTNPVIIKLNEITTFVQDKSKLTEVEVVEIKKIFKELVKNGERYDVDEIEFWFENEGTWKVKEPRVRITNLSSYVQDKHQQTAHLRLISDDDCSCGN
ncbi:hypothetical protein OAJ58_00685 [Nitrosopumilus sp.]|jgi:hypothetical protein|nr:hypothetical protein [Nitrosopumilus sp.]MDC0205051.1 hypothetical protein [Nitrosopumilus sp.]MDC0329959.1 hypothetical protein [Nitrosopumilus sp.]|tara:strand:- start:206 stop:598 length:393 start_codon:yes stop_codon:yes gene_type:complete